MAKGTEIIVSANPQGKFLEGVLGNTTPSPGTLMEIDPGASTFPASSGEFQWRHYQPGTDGNRRLIAVLLPDRLQGKLATDAYVASTRCFLYVPIPGEMLNMLYVGDSASHAVGDVFIAQTSSGLLVVTAGSPQSQPFQILEAFTSAQTTANFLGWSLFTGY
jgi:hypothetical protein